jgi:hypothetical protein
VPARTRRRLARAPPRRRRCRGSPGRARAHAAARARAGLPVASAGPRWWSAGALAPAAPLRLALSDAPAPDVTLATPAAYAAFSPFTRLADALCLLSTAQHAAVLATLFALAAAWAVARRRRGAGALRAAGRAAAACLAALAGYVALLAAAVFLPRPMAALVAADPDEARVDVHTHTSASHDVPAWFTPGAAAGVARGGGLRRGLRVGPQARGRRGRGGAGQPGARGRRARRAAGHRGVVERHPRGRAGRRGARPGAAADDQMERAPARRRWRAGGSRAAPRPWARHHPRRRAARRHARVARLGAVVRGVEVVDGAPRGLAQQDRERRRSPRAPRRSASCRSRRPTTTAGGARRWGGTSCASPGWRALAPAALGARVEDVLRRGDRRAVRVVERARPRRRRRARRAPSRSRRRSRPSCGRPPASRRRRSGRCGWPGCGRRRRPARRGGARAAGGAAPNAGARPPVPNAGRPPRRRAGRAPGP